MVNYILDMLKIEQGDLFQRALKGEFDVIGHGTNCFCTAPYGGIAALFEKHFVISDMEGENPMYRGKYNKMASVGMKKVYIHEVTKQLIQQKDFEASLIPQMYKHLVVANCYTQFNAGPDLDTIALLMCLKKLAYYCKANNSKLAIPLIGCGIAGGDPKVIVPYMQKLLAEVDATLIVLPEDFKRI
jgi:O-acetyl-ADP-ribose deacetylase (regulator of RNase III)